MEKHFMVLRKELDDLGYRQTLRIECVPLVNKLLSDLKTTTENLQKYMTISKNALDELNNLELRAEPYKCDNAKLIKECNDLHLAFIHFKEQHEKVQKDLRTQNSILENRLAECEAEKENLRQQIKQLKAGLRSNLKNLNKTSKSSLGQSTKDIKLGSTMSCSDERISTFQKEIRKLKEDQLRILKNNEFLKSQLDNRNQEIQRLSSLLEGGRPTEAQAKDCCYKNIDNKIGALQDEICALKAEKSILDAQLKQTLAKQHEAMRRALHLAERNKQLEKEMKAIDQIALQVESDCNNTVRNNSEKVLRLQDKLNESMMKIESLEKDIAKLKQEKMSIQADLDSLNLENRHLRSALESETEDKKRLTDRINNLTRIEHDLNMEIDRLVRLTGEQKLEIAELESLKKRTKDAETDGSPTRTKIKSGPSKKSAKKPMAKGSFQKESSKIENGHSKITKCCCESGGCVKQMIELLNKEMEFRQEQACQQIENVRQEKEYYMKEYHKIADELRSVPDRETYNRVQRQYDELLKKIEERNQTILDLQKEIRTFTDSKYSLSSRPEPQRDSFENGDNCQKTSCKRKRRELELHRDEVKQLQRENDSLKSRIQELNQSTIFDQERMKKAFQDMEEHIRKLEDERRDLVVNQRTSRSNMTQLEDECIVLKDKLRATQNELNTQKASYEQLKNLHEQANLALSDSRSQLADTERELQSVQSKLSNGNRETAGQEREIGRLQNDVEVMKKQLTKLDKEKDDLLNVLDEKTEKIDNLEGQLSEKKNVISMLESEMKDLKRKLSKLSEENCGYELQLKGTKQELNALQKDYDNVVRTKDAALQENRRLHDDLASVAADCKDARKELEISKRQIDDLKRQLQHYVAEVKRFEDQISQKELERAEILDQFKSLSAEANHLETTNHTLENEAAQSKVQLSVALDHASDLERKLDNKDAIIRSYEKQIAEMSSQVATLEIQLKQRNSQYEKLEDELRQMKDLCVQLDREKDELRRELQNKEDHKGITQRNIEKLSRENDDLKRAVVKDRNNVDGLEKLLNDARQEVIEQKLINQDLQTELTRMKARLEEVQERLNITSEQLDLYQEKALEYSQQNKQLRREIANERFFRAREDDNKRKVPSIPNPPLNILTEEPHAAILTDEYQITKTARIVSPQRPFKHSQHVKSQSDLHQEQANQICSRELHNQISDFVKVSGTSRSTAKERHQFSTNSQTLQCSSRQQGASADIKKSGETAVGQPDNSETTRFRSAKSPPNLRKKPSNPKQIEDLNMQTRKTMIHGSDHQPSTSYAPENTKQTASNEVGRDNYTKSAHSAKLSDVRLSLSDESQTIQKTCKPEEDGKLCIRCRDHNCCACIKCDCCKFCIGKSLEKETVAKIKESGKHVQYCQKCEEHNKNQFISDSSNRSSLKKSCDPKHRNFKKADKDSENLKASHEVMEKRTCNADAYKIKISTTGKNVPLEYFKTLSDNVEPLLFSNVESSCLPPHKFMCISDDSESSDQIGESSTTRTLRIEGPDMSCCISNRKVYCSSGAKNVSNKS